MNPMQNFPMFLPMPQFQQPQPERDKVPDRVRLAQIVMLTFLEEMNPSVVPGPVSNTEPDARTLDIEERKVYVHALDVIDKFILGEIKTENREKIEEGRVILCPLCGGGQAPNAALCPLCSGRTKLMVVPG